MQKLPKTVKIKIVETEKLLTIEDTKKLKGLLADFKSEVEIITPRFSPCLRVSVVRFGFPMSR